MSGPILDDHEKTFQVPITIRESWAWRLHIFLLIWILILRIFALFRTPGLQEVVFILLIAWPLLFFFFSNYIPMLAVEKLTINQEGLEWHKGRKVRRIAWQHINAIVRNDISDGLGRGWGTTIRVNNEDDLALNSHLSMKRRDLIELISQRATFFDGRPLKISGFDPTTIPKARLEWATFIVIPVVIVPFLLIFVVKLISRSH